MLRAMLKLRSSSLLLAPTLVLLVSCGTGGVGQAARPDAKTAEGALDDAKCQDVSSGGEPLVVDWKPEQRGDLEIAMREGIAVVNYSCEGLKLLKDCHIEGNYGYLGMTRKEQVVRLNDSDEVRANLPLSGVQLSAELKRGSSLDVAMVMVGKQKTTWSAPSKADLKGSCDGATHFVRGATVGAFVLETNTSGEAKAAAAFFGAETGGASSSKRQVQNKDGDLSSCKSATPKSADAPDQCGAPIRLLLAPVQKEAVAAEAPQKAADLARTESACPTGLVLAEGKCTKPSAAPAYQCKDDDAKECTEQCDKGHAGSCSALGVLVATGSGGATRDAAKAVALFEKACKGGDVGGCVNQGRMLLDGAGTTKDEAAAAKLFEQGCTDGNAVGCGFYGLALRDGLGVAKDAAKAAETLKQACDGGHDKSCGHAGRLYAADGPAQDLALAGKLFERACRGSDGSSCHEVGLLYELGKGVGKNPIMAQMSYDRGCILADGDSCFERARLEASKQGGGNESEAKRLFGQGCAFRSAAACAALKILYAENRPFAPPSPTQSMSWRQTCDRGDNRSCVLTGLVSGAMGNKAAAGMDLGRACRSGDGFACAAEKRVK